MSLSIYLTWTSVKGDEVGFTDFEDIKGSCYEKSTAFVKVYH